MSIKVNLFYPKLQQTIGQKASLEVNGNTVGECLNDLIRRFPGAEKLLFDESDRLLRQVFVFLNAESIHPPALTDEVKEGDTLIIAVLVTGG